MVEIPKVYEPRAVEEKWYAFWLREKCFEADPGSSKPAYSIVVPPPNITGMLHMGHVLNNTIQDLLSRKARMDGFEVLWMPGTDHAGISTQSVVEKALKKDGLMRHRDDIGREKFLEHVWAWREKHGSKIIQQLKALGCSCDWSRERFTMDPAYSRCVQMVFVDLYKKGLIYRGKRMVNWDPAARTALSDEEVEMVEQKSHLWHLKYPLLGEDGKVIPDQFIIVATTRPETMLGDEAVAVNPKDTRYTNFVGRKCLLPLQNRPIPIIADDFVDPKFGTGCVKVTPAHDRNDYEMGLRHNLPITTVIAPDATMTATAGEAYAGLDRFEARKLVVEKLTESGLLLKTEDYVHSVGLSQRSNVPVEPYLSEQWFLKYPSVDKAANCVVEPPVDPPQSPDSTESNEESTSAKSRHPADQMYFYPGRWTKTYAHWMNKLKDWCISRQLWWGHRIPVWYHPDEPEPRCQIDSPGEGWSQDADVLDTWFSSWLWPFATMGWPEVTPTLKKFYPTTDLVTAPDIIFFWVARMIMAGYEYMGDLPFRNVYFTGLIRDKQGRKMSKTLGNSPDPLDLIAKYGADALRFGTMRSAPLGADVLFDEKDVELGRNFCNKLWNACRFRQMQGGEVQAEIVPQLLSMDDKWILLKLNQAIQEITAAFENYRFNEAAQTLYRFFWSEYCDWYVEASKAVLTRSTEPAPESASLAEPRRVNTLAVLDFVLSHTLRLFHPFLPFITEELWHGMGYSVDMPEKQGGKTIMFANWPKAFDEDFRGHYGLDDCYLEMVNAKYDLVSKGRNLRREANIPSSRKVKYVFAPLQELLPHDHEVLRLLLNAETLELNANYEPKQGTPMVRCELGTLFLPLEGVVDAAAEKVRLNKELEKIEAELAKALAKFGNPAFAQKAPPNVLADLEKRIADWNEKKNHVLQLLKNLGGQT